MLLISISTPLIFKSEYNTKNLFKSELLPLIIPLFIFEINLLRLDSILIVGNTPIVFINSEEVENNEENILLKDKKKHLKVTYFYLQLQIVLVNI
jgi:hypothetical protein